MAPVWRFALCACVLALAVRDGAGQIVGCKLDVVLAIDRSGSICNNGPTECTNMDSVLAFSQNLVRGLLDEVDAQVGVLSFSDSVRVEQTFSSDETALVSSIAGLKSTGKTVTKAAIAAASQSFFFTALDRADAANVFILITDGTPNNGTDGTEYTDSTISEADTAMAAGIKFLVVGVTAGSDFDATLVRRLSSLPRIIDQDYFVTPNFEGLDDTLVALIVESSCIPIIIGGECKLDVTLVVDRSGSICNNAATSCTNLDLVKAFTKTIAADLYARADTQIAMVTFSDSSKVEHPFTRVQATINTAVDTIKSNGKTVTKAAIGSARTIFRGTNVRADATNVILLLTDGTPNNGTADKNPYTQATIEEADAAMNEDIEVIVVGVRGSDFNESIVARLSSDPKVKDQTYFIADNFVGLDEILIDSIITRTCEIAVGTTTTVAPDPCAFEADVYLAVDGSGSINELDFKSMLQFSTNLINSLPIDSGRTRLGFDLFSNTSDMKWDLNTYSTRAQMVEAISALKFPRGKTNMGDSIRVVTERLGNTGRSTVPQILVLLTDGNANDRADALERAHLAKKQGIHIVAVGIGTWMNSYDLRAMVSYPYSKNFITVDGFSNLDEALRVTVTDIICGNGRYCSPDNPCPSGQTCVEAYNTYFCEVTDSCSADIVLAVDASGSIGEENFRVQMDFVQSFIKKLNFDQARLGMVKFETEASNRFFMNEYTGTLEYLNAIEMYYPENGKTNLTDALATMRVNQFQSSRGDRSSVPNNVGLFLTDGIAENAATMMEEAEAAHAAGITTLAISVGSRRSTHELDALTSYPAEALLVDDFASLESVVDNVIAMVCNSVNECLFPENACANGGTAVDLIGGCRCDCPTGFSGRFCERECDSRYDIGFVIDVSGSIRRERFHIITDLIKSVIEEFEVDSDRARFAALTFSDTASMGFNLDRYSSMTELLVAIDNLEYVGGKTNIADALEMAKDNMFSLTNGDRGGVMDYLVFVTDGAANINEDQVIPMAVELRVQGVKLIVVGLGEDAYNMQIQNMATDPISQMMMMQESMTSLRDTESIRTALINNIVDATCDDVNECSPNPCVRGTCEDDLFRFYCMCPSGFVGPTCNLACSTSQDVVIILDLSGSTNARLLLIKDFAKTIVDHLDVGGRARIGAIRYSTDAVVMFHLSDYTSKREALEAISFVQMNARTDTAEALELLTTELFVVGNGDRSGVSNKAILISDGGANMDTATRTTTGEATAAKNQGIELYVVMVGDSTENANSISEAEAIASSPASTHVKKLTSTDDIGAVATEIINDICQ